MKEIILLMIVVCGACAIGRSLEYLCSPSVDWVIEEMRAKAQSQGGVFVHAQMID
jgi:hypothetical protein